MAFQIDERMVAANRAIITRNKNIGDITGKGYRPGMIHFTSDDNGLWVSAAPDDKRAVYQHEAIRIATERNLGEVCDNSGLTKLIMQHDEPDTNENTLWVQIV